MLKFGVNFKISILNFNVDKTSDKISHLQRHTKRIIEASSISGRDVNDEKAESINNKNNKINKNKIRMINIQDGAIKHIYSYTKGSISSISLAR